MPDSSDRAVLAVLDEVFAQAWARTEDQNQSRLLERLRDVVKEMLDATA